jgi:EGF domain-specific O-GlcNAc transferase
LTTFEGKKVCFKNLVLPLLPRMIFGLYYNTPLFSNCRNSGLFRAFSQFLPHRLGVESSRETDSSKVRVTVIKRLTKFRRILNLGTLVDALESTGKFEVTVAEFSHGMPFKKQLEVVRQTDVLVGMHGAGGFTSFFAFGWCHF